MTSDATMLAEGVAVFFTRLALARGDDPLPLDLISVAAGVPVDRVADIAARMRRISDRSGPSWWDVAARPDEWVPASSVGVHASSVNYLELRRAGVPHVTVSGGNVWHRPELEAWAAANRGDLA